MKKLIVLLLTVTFACGLFAGCGNSAEKRNKDNVELKSSTDKTIKNSQKKIKAYNQAESLSK